MIFKNKFFDAFTRADGMGCGCLNYFRQPIIMNPSYRHTFPVIIDEDPFSFVCVEFIAL